MNEWMHKQTNKGGYLQLKSPQENETGHIISSIGQ